MRFRNYLLATIVPSALSGIMAAYVAANRGADELMPFAGALALVPTIATWVLVYKMWNAVRQDGTRPGPAVAVLGLLVPFFNVFWAWRVWVRWPAAYRAYVEREDLDVPTVTEPIFRSFMVLTYVSVGLLAVGLPAIGDDVGILLTGAGAVAALLSGLLFFVVAGRVCSAVNRIRSAPRDAAAPEAAALATV